MSKISDYQKALLEKEKQEECKLQTVEEFAIELAKKPLDLIKQLKNAGVKKTKITELLTSEEKSQLHKYFQDLILLKVPRKKITIQLDPETNKLIRRVAEKENGAEYDALNYFFGAVVFGGKITPEFQKLINVIVAKAVLIGALPMQKLGRPKVEKLDSVGLQVASRYWGLIDSGVSYDEAVQNLSSEFHKSERHIMRLIAPNKKTVGETPEKRARNRSRSIMMYEINMRYPNSLDTYKKLFESKIPVPKLTDDDYIEHLEEMIVEIASRVQPLTEKI